MSVTLSPCRDGVPWHDHQEHWDPTTIVAVEDAVTSHAAQADGGAHDAQVRSTTPITVGYDPVMAATESGRSGPRAWSESTQTATVQEPDREMR